MASFKDTTGKAWSLNLTIGAVKRVRELAGVDLLKVLDGEIAERLEDPITLVDVLFALCKPEADAIKISDEQFAGRIGPNTLADAADALMEAIADFFPDAKAKILRRAREKGKAMEAAAIRRLDAHLDAIDVDAELAKLGI